MSDRGARVAAARQAARPGWRGRAIALGAAVADGIFWFLIVLTGIVGLSPLSGLAAARDTIAARRERRARIATASSEVWARQARRNAALADRGFAMPRTPWRDP
jgi:hypothetical protein